MASDDEIARHVARMESQTWVAGTLEPSSLDDTAEDLAEYRQFAGEIHDELARRIERVDEDALDEDALEDVRRRLDRLESRLDALEARGQD